jgi:hypothetical protein
MYNRHHFFEPNAIKRYNFRAADRLAQYVRGRIHRSRVSGNRNGLGDARKLQLHVQARPAANQNLDGFLRECCELRSLHRQAVNADGK